MEERDLISIIIPVYNVEKYLSRCLETVTHQTYQNLEIILVDDGSTDSSGKMCDEYAKRDKRVRVVHAENGGAGYARNIGLQNARGRYIGFVDSDDWIEVDAYEYLYHLIKSENADIAAYDFHSTTDRNYHMNNTSAEQITLMNHEELMLFFFRINGEKSFYAVWNMLYKKDIIHDCKFPEGRITEDLLFNYKAYKKCNRYVLSNQKKYYYFYNSKGVTRKKLGTVDLALIDNWDSIIASEREETQGMLQYAELNRQRTDFTLLSKAFLYGYEKEEIGKDLLYKIYCDLRKHWKTLMKGNLLDNKRKILMLFLCLNYGWILKLK